MSLKTKVQALLTSANAKTSAGDTNLTAAVKTLIDGYGHGGGGAQPQRDVNFIDYDGTILHSYTAAEFAALTAMPDNPDHTSDIQWGGHTIPLTSQGWNWSLADAKAYVAAYGKLWIGQMYVPTDGKLHLCVRMGEGRLNPASRFTFTGTATIDWGDGTTPTNAVSDADNEHTYSAAGDYDVAIAVSEGGTLGFVEEYVSFSMLFHKQYTEGFEYVENFVYGNSIKYVFIPYSVTSIGPAALSECYSLQSVTIPDSVTSFGEASFAECRSLQSITLPDSVTSIENGAFFNCISLQRVAISNSIVSINDEAFSKCHSLQSVTIPDSVTSFGESVFYDCYSLKNVTISDSVTSIEYGVFLDCNSMQSVTIPDNVTSIGEYAFQTCSSMTSIVIPESVISIGNYAFLRCFGLGFIRFESATPPTVSGSNTWEYIPTDCKIYVPSASLEAYKSATNYPDPSVYTYVGY